MKIYIDKECKCHTTPKEELREFDVPRFDGMCEEFIEGFRFIPEGELWTRSDGVVFKGKMLTPWKPYSELDSAQRESERNQIAEYESALSEIETALGVAT